MKEQLPKEVSQEHPADTAILKYYGGNATAAQVREAMQPQVDGVIDAEAALNLQSQDYLTRVVMSILLQSKTG